MKKILITGGLGFMGYHLNRYLLENYEGLQITVIDNLSSSKVEFGEIYDQLNVRVEDFKESDILNINVDEIYHLASPVGSLGILKNNGFIAQEIISLTYKAIAASERSGARLLCVSSSEVYGRSGIHDEGVDFHLKNKFGTRSEYALGKLTSEVILHNLAEEKGISYNVVRPFNVVGEQQSSKIGFVVPTFYENAIAGEPLPVFNDGTQQRSFCHVSDVVRAFVMIMNSKVSGETFNVGNGNNIIAIKELAERIVEISGSNSDIEYVDPVKIYGKSYIEAFDKVPDISKLRDMIGWEPTLDLNSTLQKIFNSYCIYEDSLS